MDKGKHRVFVLLVITSLALGQFACAAMNMLACAAKGGDWRYYGEEKGVCEIQNRPEPPLWSDPEPLKPEEKEPDPEVEETLEPLECNERASVNVVVAPNLNTACGCAYYVHFTSQEDTIIYYRTQKYIKAEPQQHWQYQELTANQTWTWSSEDIVDGQCISTYLDEVTVFLAIPGCDNMYKTASWAINEYSVPVEMLCR